MDDVIRIKKRGSFHVGGEKIKLENVPVEDFPYMGKFTFRSDPNGTHWVKQMYVQYSIVDEPVVPYPVLMWHGGGLSGVTYETTPDGREGWDTLFLRNGYSVYVSDAVERGRAGWAKFPEVNPTPPIFHTYEARWLNLKMGETYPIPYEGNRFPIEHYDELMMQASPRWLTSDEWTMDAYEKYLEKLKDEFGGVIILAHSQGGMYALQVARKFPDFVKGLILVEPAGFPEDSDDVSGLAKIPQLYVWADYMSEDYKVVHSWVDSIRKNTPRYRKTLDDMGTDYTWMSLPEHGIHGNSHMLMMDNNNDVIADMICDWVKAHVK